VRQGSRNPFDAAVAGRGRRMPAMSTTKGPTDISVIVMSRRVRGRVRPRPVRGGCWYGQTRRREAIALANGLKVRGTVPRAALRHWRYAYELGCDHYSETGCMNPDVAVCVRFWQRPGRWRQRASGRRRRGRGG